MTPGQELGQVGNSGSSFEPHLHIHAVEAGSPDVIDGEGKPILFNGNFPVWNKVFIRP